MKPFDCFLIVLITIVAAMSIYCRYDKIKALRRAKKAKNLPPVKIDISAFVPEEESNPHPHARPSALDRSIAASNMIERGKTKQEAAEATGYASVDSMQAAFRRYKRHNAVGSCGRCGKTIRRDALYCDYCAGFYKPIKKEEEK